MESRDSESLSRQLNLDDLAARDTPLFRRVEILSVLKERFDTLVASQLSQSHVTLVLPALCEVRPCAVQPNFRDYIYNVFVYYN